MLDAADMVEYIAGDMPLKTEHYTVEERVPTDGFMAEFTVFSDFGTFQASGPGMLAARVNEIRALAALEHIEQDEQFQKGATESVKETGSNLQQLVEHPKETLESVPEGVGRFFKRTYRAAKTGLQKVDDVRHGRTPGVDDDRRRLAKELAVDPYTTNAVLAQKLDDVTWAAFAGNLGVSVLTSMIPGGLIVSTSSRLTDWVWDTPPGDLRLEIEATLRDAGVDQDRIDRFLRHRWYPLSLQAALAASLKAMDDVDGRAEVIPLALAVDSEGQARFVVQTLAMLARHHKTVEPLTKLAVSGTVFGETEDGALAVMAPVDYLSWNPVAATFAQRKGKMGTARTLHIAGLATDRARDALEDLDWSVEEESVLFVPVIATDVK